MNCADLIWCGLIIHNLCIDVGDPPFPCDDDDDLNSSHDDEEGKDAVDADFKAQVRMIAEHLRARGLVRDVKVN